MKKIILFLMTVLTVVFLQVPFFGTAEAARVAVVPIQINDTLVERSADFNGYYWDIMIDKFKYRCLAGSISADKCNVLTSFDVYHKVAEKQIAVK